MRADLGILGGSERRVFGTQKKLPNGLLEGRKAEKAENTSASSKVAE